MTQPPLVDIKDDKAPARDQADTSKPWTWYVLVILTCEKIVQHIAVTLALFNNWNGIRSRMAVNPDVLMVLGGIVAVLFGLSLVGLLHRRSWASGLLIGLAVFDMVGEFIAQGVGAIVITVSFLVATVILILTLIYRRQTRHGAG